MAPQNVTSPIDEVLDFLLSQPSLQQVITLRASEAAQRRLRYLLEGSRCNTLNEVEQAELEAYVQLDALVMRLKTLARFKLARKVRRATEALPTAIAS